MEDHKKSNTTETIFNFYVDLLENHPHRVMYYLSENSVLDWFGQTVKGATHIQTFFKTHAGNVSHIFNTPKEVDSIQCRDEPIVVSSRATPTKDKLFPIITEDSQVTPPDRIIPLKKKVNDKEMGQGDGPHNSEESVSPTKKPKPNTSREDSTSPNEQKMNYLSCQGSVQFHKKSTKKLQRETKWNRPCKLEIAFTGTKEEDCTFYFIVYKGNVKCRRNLLKEFEATLNEVE